jgi:hypothetical protein
MSLLLLLSPSSWLNKRPLQRLLLQRRRHSKQEQLLLHSVFKPHSHLLIMRTMPYSDWEWCCCWQGLIAVLTVYCVLHSKAEWEDSEEGLKVYQIDREIKSFVWMIWDCQQTLTVKKFCDNKSYFYHRHNIKATINCSNSRKNFKILVTLRNASDWVRVKNHIKLWNSLKKKRITVIIKGQLRSKGNWRLHYWEEWEKKKKEKKKKN